MGRRGFGYLRRLPSKRYQASYIGPDPVSYTHLDVYKRQVPDPRRAKVEVGPQGTDAEPRHHGEGHDQARRDRRHPPGADPEHHQRPHDHLREQQEDQHPAPALGRP